ncbi:MAG TPA: AtpZ/AtpI family protein [bacterium]|nr:AtpZ/AtpI family protein [bacterium]
MNKQINEENNNTAPSSNNTAASREKKIKELGEILKLTSVVSNIGFTMIACIIVGFFAGLGIENFILKKYFGIKPNSIFVIIFTIFGVIAGFVNVYKFIQKKILNFKIEEKDE